MSIDNYEKFLTTLNNDLNKIFKYQEEYIFCKEGCSFCCEQGEYPVSELEFEYMQLGYEQLSEDTKEVIKKNIQELKNNPQKMYKCPFLINKSCCIYKHRAIVCRTFGIMTETKDSVKVPFCHKLGLNYSNIYDPKTDKLSMELYEQGNFKIPLKPFNLEPQEVMNFDLAKELNLDFGERKRLIDWL